MLVQSLGNFHGKFEGNFHVERRLDEEKQLSKTQMVMVSENPYMVSLHPCMVSVHPYIVSLHPYKVLLHPYKVSVHPYKAKECLLVLYD